MKCCCWLCKGVVGSLCTRTRNLGPSQSLSLVGWTEQISPFSHAAHLCSTFVHGGRSLLALHVLSFRELTLDRILYHLIIRQSFLENVFRRFTPRRTRHNILIDYSKPQSDIFWLILDEKGKPYAKCFCLLMGGKSNYWSGSRGFRNSYVPKLHFLVKRLSHSSDD